VERLAARQHWVVSRRQLLGLGIDAGAIERRLRGRRLRALHRGVYAVGRPEVSRRGAFLAAVLACGPQAALSHGSAGLFWGIVGDRPMLAIEVTAPSQRRRPGLTAHRRTLAASEITRRHGIPATSPATTLLDLATRLDRPKLERAIGEADRLDVIDPERLRAKLDRMDGRSGVRALRATLDRHTFRLTRSELERLFIPIARRAGLRMPETLQVVDGFEVDFFWPELGLVVETDGLRHHRTPAQQAKDLVRDQAHKAAGRECLRFSHAQVRYDPRHVERTLTEVSRRLGS